jgi:hypothetical protein
MQLLDRDAPQRNEISNALRFVADVGEGLAGFEPATSEPIVAERCTKDYIAANSIRPS